MPESPWRRPGAPRAPVVGEVLTWKRTAICQECDWTRTVRSSAVDGGAAACRRACREHRQKTRHKAFLIGEGHRESKVIKRRAPREERPEGGPEAPVPDA